MNNVIVISGGFDPPHSGHINLVNSAKHYGDYLIVGVNSDAWLSRKKGRAFMPFNERAAIMSNLKSVDEVMSFNDDDGTACDLLEKVKSKFKGSRIVFANGGDRTAVNIPEMKVDGVEFIFGVGGSNKANSSSWILQEWKSPKTERQWGYYRVLHEVPGCKVKELTVEPWKSLSMQRHFNRSEYWMVSEGVATLNSISDTTSAIEPLTLRQHEAAVIPVESWHQLANNTDEIVRIVEIQYGDECIEDDIERAE